MKEGLKNLTEHNNKVDYIITHCTSTTSQKKINSKPEYLYVPDILTDYLEKIEKQVQYQHWYFGHYHDDRKIDEKHTLLYESIIPIGKE